MREYGAVSPQFWLGKTGKKLRGDLEAQVLAFYLMTSPHANMIGVFYCPVMYMSKETGLPIEGASKALGRLVEEGFCVYDEESETIFVRTMVEHQVGKDIKPGDKRLMGIRKEWQKIAVPCLKRAFFDQYATDYGLEMEGHASPLQAPTKQLTEQEQEQDKSIGASGEAPAAPAPPPAQDQNQDQEAGTRIGRLCKRIRQEAQLHGVYPANPTLIALIDAGYTDEEILAVSHEAAQKGKPWGWVVVAVQGRRKDALAVKAAPPAEDKFAGVL